MSCLIIHESHVQVLPSLACQIGLNEAMILQHLYKRLDPNHDEDVDQEHPRMNSTYEKLQRQFPFWSVSTIKRTIRSLEQQNLIVSCKVKEVNLDHRKWYSICDESLNRILKTLHFI